MKTLTYTLLLVVCIYSTVQAVPNTTTGQQPIQNAIHHIDRGRSVLSNEGKPRAVQDKSEKMEKSRNETCGYRSLEICGRPVVDAFSETMPPMEERCIIRREFLDCIIRMKKEPCGHVSPAELPKEGIRALREKVLEHLWTARGCVFDCNCQGGVSGSQVSSAPCPGCGSSTNTPAVSSTEETLTEESLSPL